MIRISNCFEPEIREAINEVERLRKENALLQKLLDRELNKK